MHSFGTKALMCALVALLFVVCATDATLEDELEVSRVKITSLQPPAQDARDARDARLKEALKRQYYTGGFQTGRGHASKIDGCKATATAAPSDAAVRHAFQLFFSNAALTGNGLVSPGVIQCANPMVPSKRIDKILKTWSFRNDCQGGSVYVTYQYWEGVCKDLYANYVKADLKAHVVNKPPVKTPAKIPAKPRQRKKPQKYNKPPVKTPAKTSAKIPAKPRQRKKPQTKWPTKPKSTVTPGLRPYRMGVNKSLVALAKASNRVGRLQRAATALIKKAGAKTTSKLNKMAATMARRLQAARRVESDLFQAYNRKVVSLLRFSRMSTTLFQKRKRKIALAHMAGKKRRVQVNSRQIAKRQWWAKRMTKFCSKTCHNKGRDNAAWSKAVTTRAIVKRNGKPVIKTYKSKCTYIKAARLCRPYRHRCRATCCSTIHRNDKHALKYCPEHTGGGGAYVDNSPQGKVKGYVFRFHTYRSYCRRFKVEGKCGARSRLGEGKSTLQLRQSTAIFQLKLEGRSWKPVGYVNLMHRACKVVNGVCPRPRHVKGRQRPRSLDFYDCLESKEDLAECLRKKNMRRLDGIQRWPSQYTERRARAMGIKLGTPKKGAIIQWPNVDPYSVDPGYSVLRRLGRDLCARNANKYSVKQVLYNCISKARTRVASHERSMCRTLKQQGQCSVEEPYCHKSNGRHFMLGAAMCTKTTGAASCITQCMRMTLGCSRAGPSCLTKKAREWRCASDSARGVTCITNHIYDHHCIKLCQDPRLVAIHDFSLKLKGNPLIYETLTMKRVATWNVQTALSDLHGHWVNFRGKMVQVNPRVDFYLDGLKILICHRQQSFAGPLECRVTKSVEVTQLCLSAEVGCMKYIGIREACATLDDWRLRQRGHIKTILPLTCCHKSNTQCIQKKLAKWMKLWTVPQMVDPKKWTSLATADALAV